MEYSEFTFHGKDDIELYAQSWYPKGQARAAVILVHGLGEYCGRHINTIDQLYEHDYIVYGFDQRGHGQSSGKRGHIDSWDQYRQDAHAFVTYVKTHCAADRYFLMGHSMGSVVAMDYALRNPQGLAGLIVSAPPLDLGAVSPVLIFMTRVLSVLWPGFTLNAGLDVNHISRDPQEVRIYAEDPMVHGQISARFGAELFKTAQWVSAHPELVRLPLLILHGSGDQIANLRGSQQFFDAVEYPDKSLSVFDDAHHEVHNDPARDEFFRDLVAWLDLHSGVESV